MRKTIFLLIAGTVFLGTTVAWADTGGSASATLTLNAVINIAVTDNWNDLTINQGDIAGWAAGTVIEWDSGERDITVVIKALTDFILWGCYYAKEGGNNVDPAFGNADDLIILNDGTSDFTLTYEEIANPNSFGNNPGDDYNVLTKLYTFTDNNNIGSGGTTLNYEVKLKPENLGDREAGENITFTIVFVVEEKSNI